ncbi:MAG: ATP-binding protein, partial [Melioribacteraceae bacterium]|nr:ATP-binding protein [Melioribacteraceae bacterium]
MQKERYLTKNIVNDIQEKMVFIGGARQVGKTTLARDIVSAEIDNSQYFNWDYTPDRKKIKNLELPGNNSLLIFDEIHKYKKWKTTIKGIYDVHKEKYKIIVTGSAKMNVFRKGGDSLQGRYHYYNLHPFSLAEVSCTKNNFSVLDELQINTQNNTEQFETLFKFGGFPEVLINESTRGLRRWHNEKLERLFREDIRDVENIRDIGSMKLLGDMLPQKVGSPLSINAIREDLEVSHRAVTNWLSILELFYYHFRIYPFHSNKIRSLKKEAKLYLTDWSEIEEEGIRFENLIASHLLKFVEYLKQSEGYKTELNYLRNVDKK